MAIVLAWAGIIGCFFVTSWRDVALVAMLFGMALVFQLSGGA